MNVLLDKVGKPVDAGLSLTTGVRIDLNASLLSVANGSATATITATVLGVPLTVPVAPLNAALKAITAPVAGTVNEAAKTLAAKVAAGVGASLQDQVKPATLSIPGFLTLKVNVQSEPVPGTYQVTALQVAINAPFGNLATINLATSRVGASPAVAATAARSVNSQLAAAAGAMSTGPLDANPQGLPTAPPSPNTVAAAAGTVVAPHQLTPSLSPPAIAAAPQANLDVVVPAVAVAAPVPVESAVTNAANTTTSGSATPDTQWLTLAALVMMAVLTSAGIVRRRPGGRD